MQLIASYHGYYFDEEEILNSNDDFWESLYDKIASSMENGGMGVILSMFTRQRFICSLAASV
jgi:hypothetical protein